MRELFIPKCWIEPSVQSVFIDLLAALLIIVGIIYFIVKFRNPIPFLFTFLSIRAFSMGIVGETYFNKS